MSKLTV